MIITSAVGRASAFILLACALSSAAYGQAPPARFDFDPAELRDVALGRGVALDLPVPGKGDITLGLTRFGVTTGETRFVLAGPGRLDAAHPFDASGVVLLRGGVEGDAHSHAFVTVYEGAMHGRVEFGTGERFVIAGSGGNGRPAPGEAVVLRHEGGHAWDPGCGVGGARIDERGGGARAEGARPGLFLVEVAVETDYELYEQFWDLDDEAAYIVQLYGAISDIYLRDVGATLTLSYVRLWDTPEDLFNEEDPLGEFRAYWNDNMGHVQRDTAQLLSGRVNFPWGGVAYVAGVCGDRGYSVSGYTLGFFADAARPSVYNRDVLVAAHELGHNLGTLHTHDYGIDECHDPRRPAQRGTIMSYCGQTHTGGSANEDVRFDTFTAGEIRAVLALAGCVADDCNLNGVPDGEDISGGTSQDANANGVPDECEDCNGNGVLDPADIAGGGSADVNGNGRPDECEPDCNGNGLPDTYDIAEGTSADAYLDGVPDECETDCDGDGTSDYTEISLAMSLDLDRDAALDACEDCDGDGATDLVEMAGANDVWVADKGRGVLREFLSVTGTVVRDSDDAALAEPGDVLALPDGRVLVASAGDARIVAFDKAGALLGDLVGAGGGGLQSPGAMCVSPWGALLVASGGTDSVKAYDPASGSYAGDLVASGAGGLVAPFGLAISPEGTLLATSADGRVLEFGARDGAFLRELVSAGDNGGLTDPRGVLALPDGRVLVASRGTNRVLEFDGATGAFIRTFNRGGTADLMTLDQPWCIRLGPEGGVYVSRAHDHESPGPGGAGALHLTNARIFHFDAVSGKLVRPYVQALDSGIEHPTGFDFVRGDGLDCNANLMPDACDIASGMSADANGDGVPDECQPCVADHDGDGLVDTRDFVAYLDDWAARRPRADTNRDLVVDSRDFVAFLNAWVLGC